MVEHPRQALVGVFGGTYISLALADIDELAVTDFALLNTADFGRPMQAIERYLNSIPHCPNKVSIAVAGSVEGDKVRFSHRDWSFTRGDVHAATGADHVCLVNDIEAIALVLPELSMHDLHDLHPGTTMPFGNKALINAGYAAGVAGLVHADGDWVPVVGEGGQMRLLPAQEESVEGSAMLSAGYRTLNDTFSGRGLVALYETLAGEAKGKHRSSGARQIAAAGLSGEDATAARCLEIMATWIGRVAGDIALLYGARGGLYLSGGLIANIVPALETGHFQAAFENRGDRSDYISRIPVKVIKTSADASMRGAAIALARALPEGAAQRRSVSSAT